MYRHINIIISATVLAFISYSAAAQDMESVLESIERNNVQLQSLRAANDAAKLETKMQNNLGDPSIEYSPFWAKGTDGISSSELVVSYGFDFPTQYVSRSRAGKLQRSAIDGQYQVERRNVLLQAKKLCLDIVFLSRKRELLSDRLGNADELLSVFSRRFSEGDASAIELNKIRMEKMDVAAALVQVETDLQTAMESLRAMNGGRPVQFDAMEYPRTMPVTDFETFRDTLMAAELELKASEADVRAAEQEIRVNRQNWLPQLQVGYRRNTALSEASNGFIVGASFPLFSNRYKSRIANARHTASQYRFNQVQIETEARIRTEYDEMMRLQEALGIYDVALMEETLEMLGKAVEAGQLSVIEYYTEADSIYSKLLSLSEMENTYQKLIADIYRNSL